MLLQNQLPIVYDQTVEVIFTVYISPCGHKADKAITSEQTEQVYNDVVLKFLGGQGQDGSTGKLI